MVTSQFNALLQDLEHFFKCKLAPDSNNSCLVKMGIGIKIQLELDRYGENLIIGSKLGSIPVGRYRELVFREALRANNLNPASSGIFGYSKKSGNLILFVKLDLRYANQEKIISTLKSFIPRAHSWLKAIQQGTIPDSIGPADTSTKSHGLFGLIR